MIWIGGQVDMSSDGAVRNPDELAVQTGNAVRHIERVLAELDADAGDLVKLVCFYADGGTVSEAEFLELLAAALPAQVRCAVTAVALPYLCYPGLAVEIDAYAMRGKDGGPLARDYAETEDMAPLPSRFVPALRCGKMIFVSAQAPLDATGAVLHGESIVAQTDRIMAQIGRILGQFGASYDDVVKLNRWYVGGSALEDFEPASLAAAAYFSEPGPVATGLPVQRHGTVGVRIKIEVLAMLGEDGGHLPRRHSWPHSLWDWHTHLPYKHGLKCADMIFLGGQVSLDKQGRAVHPDDLAAQTRQAMVHIGTILNDLGADYSDVCKVGAFYIGESDQHRLHENLAIRSSFFPEPGPATTGIPLQALAYPGMVIEIDILAMAEPDG